MYILVYLFWMSSEKMKETSFLVLVKPIHRQMMKEQK